MTMKPMYPAVVNSPGTELATDIGAGGTIITVLSANGLPAAPNLLTIGLDETAETVRYTKIEGNKLTVERGFQGVAKAWGKGTKVARYYTAYDHDAFLQNIEDVRANAGTVAKQAETNAKSHADNKLAEVKQRHQLTEGAYGILKENIDLNNLKETGFYRCNKMKNAPEGSGTHANVEVTAYDNGNVFQKFYTLFGVGVYYRWMTMSGWQPWKKVMVADADGVLRLDKWVDIKGNGGGLNFFGNNHIYQQFFIDGKRKGYVGLPDPNDPNLMAIVSEHGDTAVLAKRNVKVNAEALMVKGRTDITGDARMLNLNVETHGYITFNKGDVRKGYAGMGDSNAPDDIALASDGGSLRLNARKEVTVNGRNILAEIDAIKAHLKI